MSNEVVRLIRESLDPKLGPIEVSSRIDTAYRLFKDNRKQIALEEAEAHQVL